MNRHTVMPYLTVHHAVEAIEFYTRVFGAREIEPRLTSPDGKVLHAELTLGDSTLMLADEFPEYGNVSPQTLGGTPVRINLDTADVDAVAARARAAGAKELVPVADQFYGYRSGRFEDPFGHVWTIGTKIEDVPPDEMQRRANRLFTGC
jgi:PhnB protein